MAVSGTKMKRLRSGDSSERVALFPEGQNQSQTKRCTKCRRVLKKHIFLILIILAMAAGIGLGTWLRMLETPLTGRQIYYVSFPGELFLQMLSMLLIPLIVSSLIVATTSLTPKSSGKMGIISLVYYIGSTTLAVATGVTLVLLIRPGEADESGFGGLDLHAKAENQSTVSPDKTIDTLLDLVRNLFPGNIIEATFRRLHTVEIPKEAVNKTTFKPDMVPTAEKVEGSNILGIITFSLVLGIIISKLGNDGRPLVAFFEALNMAVMKMITLVIWYAPIGIMSLIASKIAAVEEPLTVLHQLSWFVITVVTGFGIHGLVTLPLLFLVLARRNPFAYLGNMLEAIITVFSTASSAATMPVTIRCLVENNDVDSRVVNFVIPVGTTVNMDGSAIYLAIAAIFLAQYNSMQLSAGQVITVGITSVAASVGAAPIPSGSLIAMVMVLTSVGIPTDIALIAAVDWLLDRFRGIVNVVGDSFAAGAVAQMARGGLHKERVIVEYSRFGQQETSLNLKDDYYELP